MFLQLDTNQVFLVTDRLEKFALVGESQTGKKAVKTLRLAAFAPSQVNPNSATEYTIRVYVLDDTTSALEVRMLKHFFFLLNFLLEKKLNSLRNPGFFHNLDNSKKVLVADVCRAHLLSTRACIKYLVNLHIYLFIYRESFPKRKTWAGGCSTNQEVYSSRMVETIFVFPWKM